MSEEKEMKEEIKSENQPINEQNSEETTSENSEQSQVVSEPSADEKYAELNDKFLRLYSEFDNYRKRTNKEKIELIANANAGLMKDIIPVLDDFERAIANNETAEDIAILK